jgi:hypothetical protein
MDKNFNLSVYLNEVNSIIKLVESDLLQTCLSELGNYIEQLKVVRESSIFEDDSNNCFKINLSEARSNLLFKLNQLISQKIEEIEVIM